MREDGHLPATKSDLRAVADRLDAITGRLDVHVNRLDGHDANLRRLNISFARLEGDMTEVKGTLGVIVEDFSQFKTYLERMNGNIEAALRKMDLQGGMLMDHEGRIKNLESRPS